MFVKRWGYNPNSYLMPTRFVYHHCHCNNVLNTLMKYTFMSRFLDNLFVRRTNFYPVQTTPLYRVTQPIVFPTYNTSTFDSNKFFSLNTNYDYPEFDFTDSVSLKSNKENEELNVEKKIIKKTEVVEIACRKAKQYGVDQNLVLAVIGAESNFKNGLTSSAGAQGLMQLMPSTAKSLSVKDPMDAEQNIDGGVRFLKQLSDKYNGDIKMIAAAYNAGPGHVDDVLNGTNKCGKNKSHRKDASGIPNFKETKTYVERVYNNYHSYVVA